MTTDIQSSVTEEAPRQKTDWAAIRAQNEAAFRAGMDRITTAYTEQRETPWKNWEEEFKAERRSWSAIRQIRQGLIAHGENESHARHLAKLSTRSEFGRAFSEAGYQVPRAVSALAAFDEAITPKKSEYIYQRPQISQMRPAFN